MPEDTREEEPDRGSIGAVDILGDGFFAGAIGAAAVALFFLVADAIERVPLWTPSLVGDVVLRGGEPTGEVSIDLATVALFSIVHGAAFVAYGVLCAAVLSRLRETPDLPIIALFCFVGLELGSLAAFRLMEPGLAAQIGHGYVAAGNVLAGVGMSVWLRGFAVHQDDA